jgi:hypothetical protein
VSAARRRRIAGRACVAACLAAAALAAGGSVRAAPPAADPVQARSFAVHFRPLADAAELLGSILSPEGEITLQPRIRRLVVRDHVSVLEQVGPLLESFDLPPRSVDVSISLAMGTQAQAGRNLPPDDLHPRNRGIFEVVPPVTRWTAFDPLGKRTMVGVEGSAVSSDLSEEYRVVFEVESVEDEWVKFKSFSLQRVIHDPEAGETYRNLYSAAITLKVGQPLLVGAAQAPNSKKALFLNLEVSPR